MQLFGGALPGILGIGGHLVQGLAANAAGKQNQTALYAQAREEEIAGSAQELQVRGEARKAIGQQLAAQASNGFMPGTGSALDALTESQVNAALDAMQVRRDAAGKARALRSEGDQRRREGRLGLVEGLIGAGSKYVSMRNDWADARRGQSPAASAAAGGYGDFSRGITVTGIR